MIEAVGKKPFSLFRILKAQVKDFPYTHPATLIVNRSGNLHPSKGISGHKVRTGNIDFLFFALPEAINTRMFQETPHYAVHLNILRLPGNARYQAADSAN